VSVWHENISYYAICQELGGVSTAMERQKALLHELMAVVKDMLRNTEVAVRSFMMLRPRFLHPNAGGASNATAPSQAPGTAVPSSSSSQMTATSMVPVFDFYSGVPRKPSPFLQQTVARFEKYLGECRQWIEELEQLLLLSSERSSSNLGSTLLQSLPKVMSNVHDFFLHVAAKVSQQVSCVEHASLFLLCGEIVSAILWVCFGFVWLNIQMMKWYYVCFTSVFWDRFFIFNIFG
jgi:hypothetical protein